MPQPFHITSSDDKGQSRRIKTEEQAKVVAFVWGTESIQFLALFCSTVGRYEE